MGFLETEAEVIRIFEVLVYFWGPGLFLKNEEVPKEENYHI